VVVDTRSTDRTRELAAAAGCVVLDHPFDGYPQQRDWGLRHASVRNAWILMIDADERVAPELRRSIADVLADPSPMSAYAVRFRFIFYGRWMKHSWYGTWIIRLMRRDRARYEMRGVHEHLVVDGPTGYLQGDLVHNDFRDMNAWIDKHNRYATLEAAEMMRDGRGERLQGRLFGSRVERRRWLKDRVWNRLPLRPFWVFLFLYVIRRGFLDGALGLRFCVMHAMFDGFTTAKVWESRWNARHPARNYYRELLGRELVAHPQERVYYPG
jgi:glycosyltransferase involved in cell wall biosynthesis